ncbi:hypothetical protein [Streptomyces sp. NRRL B-24484]|uniref:hypothetical protein n=1 Tax=Streptomyces sp. NRRL B-24484 TaxID=1463833 RepID=UPI0004BF89DF|nr:hypothetical protein [Streptomyces sp. NRRL B-24484]
MTDTAEATDFAWLLTLQIPIHNGFQTFTGGGIYTARAGATRDAAYKQIRAWITEQNPAMERADVLFFSLEPNRL